VFAIGNQLQMSTGKIKLRDLKKAARWNRRASAPYTVLGAGAVEETQGRVEQANRQANALHLFYNVSWTMRSNRRREMRASIAAAACLLGSFVLCGCNQPWVQVNTGSSSSPQNGLGLGAQTVQGSGNLVTTNRHLSYPFTKLAISIPAEVQVQLGKGSDLAITFDDNLLPLVKTEVTNDTLKIYTDKSINTDHSAKITINTDHLKGVNLSGVGSVNVPNLNEDEFNVSVSGAGNVFGTGKVDDVSVRMSGTGNVKLADITAQAVTVMISGAGNVEVGPSDSMEVNITGAGNVRYKGNPAIEQHITGLGTVSQM
jgi:hypothetical protein